MASGYHQNESIQCHASLQDGNEAEKVNTHLENVCTNVNDQKELKNNPHGDDESFSLDLGPSVDNEGTEEKEKNDPVKENKVEVFNQNDIVLNLNTLSPIHETSIQEQPVPSIGYYSPPLTPLLENSQVVVHKANFRFNHEINKEAIRRFEVIDETRKHLYTVEQEEPPIEDNSFLFRIFDKNKELVAEIYNPASTTCVKCNAEWHWMKRCHFQALVYCPPGEIAGFIKKEHTFFVQEFHILNAIEEELVVMRGGPQDLVLFNPNLDFEMGRMAVHGWHGVMHEIKRSGDDWGLTFPLDLDVRVKLLLISAVFSLDWLYTTHGGKKRPVVTEKQPVAKEKRHSVNT